MKLPIRFPVKLRSVYGFAGLGAVVVVIVLGLSLASPRHRAFYFGGESASPQIVYNTADAPLDWQQASVDPPLSRPRATTNGRLEVPLSEPVPWNLPSDGVPPGWSLKEFAGQADIALLRVDGRLALKLRSDRSSFTIYRDVVVDLNELPVLTWSWKVTRLPSGGDVRQSGRDDQAAAVYVVFPRWPSPLTRSDVIGYIWDTNAPVDTRWANAHASNVKLIVVESGRKDVGQWRRYERNVVADYAELFGKKPPRAGKIALMADSNDTRTDTEALFASMGFLRAR